MRSRILSTLCFISVLVGQPSFIQNTVTTSVNDGCATSTEIKQSVNRILLRIHHSLRKALDLDQVIIRIQHLAFRQEIKRA